MQKHVYCLSYVLEHMEHMDLMRNWVDIEVEMVSVCVICAVRTVKVWTTLCGIAQLIHSTVHYFLEHIENILRKEFEHFKSCDTVGKSCFILGSGLWGSRYEDLLRIVKSYITDIWEVHKSKLYDSGTGLLQYRSRPGRYGVCQGKGKFGKLGGGSHAVLFMVLLSLWDARSMLKPPSS